MVATNMANPLMAFYLKHDRFLRTMTKIYLNTDELVDGENDDNALTSHFDAINNLRDTAFYIQQLLDLKLGYRIGAPDTFTPFDLEEYFSSIHLDRDGAIDEYLSTYSGISTLSKTLSSIRTSTEAIMRVAFLGNPSKLSEHGLCEDLGGCLLDLGILTKGDQAFYKDLGLILEVSEDPFRFISTDDAGINQSIDEMVEMDYYDEGELKIPSPSPQSKIIDIKKAQKLATLYEQYAGLALSKQSEQAQHKRSELVNALIDYIKAGLTSAIDDFEMIGTSGIKFSLSGIDMAEIHAEEARKLKASHLQNPMIH